MSLSRELGRDRESRIGIDGTAPEVRLLLIGKTGNGKSSLGNAILGQDVFPTGRSMASTTTRRQVERAERNGFIVKIVDTPDVTNLGLRPIQAQDEVRQWMALTSPRPSAVIIVIRCDVRYTAEEYAIYREFLKLWGDNSIKNRLIVVFTFGDRQDQDIEQELQTVCQELKNVLNDASWRYVVFNNTANGDEKNRMVNDLLAIVQSLPEAPAPIPLSLLQLKIWSGLLLITGLGFAAGVAKVSKLLKAVFGLGFFGTLPFPVFWAYWKYSRLQFVIWYGLLLITESGFTVGVATVSKPLMAVFGSSFFGTLPFPVSWACWKYSRLQFLIWYGLLFITESGFAAGVATESKPLMAVSGLGFFGTSTFPCFWEWWTRSRF